MKKRLTYIFICFSFQVSAFSANAQQLKLGNNPTQINPSAVLELESWNQGLRLNRVDTGAVNTIINTLSSAQQDSTNGMIVYQVKDSSIYYRVGGWWRKLVIEDSLGIKSINGDTTQAQIFDVQLAANDDATFSASKFVTDFNGHITLQIAGASTGRVGVVTEGKQTWNGPKRFNDSVGIKSLSPGSVPFIGPDNYNYLSENNDSLFWDNENGRLHLSGITFTNLTTTSGAIDPTAAPIGVNSSGEVVKANRTPIYYNSSGNPLTNQVTKVLIDSITGNSVAEIKTINIPTAIGFTKILSIQLTARIVPNNDGVYGIVANVVSYNTTSVVIRITELFYTKEGGLLGLGSLIKGGSLTLPQTYDFLGSGFDPKQFTVYYRIEGY